MLGFAGIAMLGPDEVVPGWEQALAADRPVVVEAYTDPEVPPLPPHISFEQARAFAQALIKDPSRWEMLRHSAKEMVESYLPHGSS
jgi:pyruvate dehydrogenase (quinone)